MTVDFLFKKIQDIVNRNPTIVLGSGASAPYGIAGMKALADMLSSFFSIKKYHDKKIDDIVYEFLEKINTKKMGLEEALLDVRMPEIVENDIKEQVWIEIQKGDLVVYNNVVQGERLALADLLEYMIYGRSEQTINIVTTNYDRIAEYAISQTEAYLNTFFTNKPIGRFNHSLQFHRSLKGYIGHVNVLKVHGSLDWFEKDGQLFSLSNSQIIPQNYSPCIITPGTNKYEQTSQVPYRDLIQQVDNVFREASGFLCIGYGFNDKHIHPNLLNYSEKRQKPILIVAKEITDSIRSRVIDKKKYPYIIIAEKKDGGTIIYDSSETMPLEINADDFWTISGLCKIIK